nr:hypothetical protein [Tanacetum cinerariifolium]
YLILEQSCKDAAVADSVPAAATRDSERPLPLGDVAVAGTSGTVPRLQLSDHLECTSLKTVKRVMWPNTRARLLRNGENNRMMGRVGPTTVLLTPNPNHPIKFTSEYDISDDLHSKLPGPEERIVDFLEGKARPKLVISRSTCRVLNIVPTLNLFRVFYIPSFNSGWMSFSKRPEKNTPQCYTKHLDSLKNWNNRFFWVDERVFPIVTDWRTSAPKDEMPAKNTYSAKAVTILNTHRTPIQKQPEALLCLVGLSRRYFLGDDVYPTFLHDDDRDMDLFNLIRASNPTKVKTGTVPTLLMKTEDQGQETVAPEVPPSENVTTTGVALEAGLAEEIAAMGPRVIKERRKRGNDGVDTNAPPKETHVDVSDSDPLSFANPQSIPTENVAQSSKGAAVVGDIESENTSFTSMVRSLPRPGGSHSAARLRLRFEQEAKLLKKSIAQVARQDQRIQARENEIKNLEALLEAETDMKKTAEAKNAKLGKELKNLRALFSDLQVSDDRLSQQRYTEMDARLDALSIEFDDELYPYMLTAIAGRRWVIRHGLCLEVIKCGESTELRQVFANVVSAGIAKGISEGLKYGVEHGKAILDLEAIEAYDPEAKTKYVAVLHALRDLKYPMVDQLELFKDAPIDVIPVYPEVRDPKDPWAFKEEILLADAIAANVSRAEKKKKCRVVCRTHGVGSAHHARSDGVSVSVPTVAPQGLAIILADAAT